MLSFPDRERNKWLFATKEEINSMKEINVWTLTNLLPNRQAILTKWVFKLKHDAKGNICSYKARLVARGFTQKYGEDYDQTFAPVVKYETVLILLAISAKKNLHVQHLDVKSAFLHADLEEDLYMEQPQGFISKEQEKLNHSIYGLKQLARAWNIKAIKALEEQNFTRSK